MGPYSTDGHYMYGNTFVTPKPPYYDSIKHHHAPCIRKFPIPPRGDDGCPYLPDDSESNGEIIRNPLTYNLMNIETKLKYSLWIKLYGTKEDMDKELTLEIGKRYAITYLTERGIDIADGTLQVISPSIPDECRRYIGEYDDNAKSAYIGIDCSTTGKSDKRMIYIASIRYIEELEDGEDYDNPLNNPTDIEMMSDSQKLSAILELLRDNLPCPCTEDQPTEHEKHVSYVEQVLSALKDICPELEYSFKTEDDGNSGESDNDGNEDSDGDDGESKDTSEDNAGNNSDNTETGDGNITTTP